LTQAKVLAASVAIAALLGALWLGLPKLLHSLGLHGHYSGSRLDLRGRRGLIITTSRETLGDTGRSTGVYASEMTVPYYAFLDAGMTVDLASIKGGPIPIEPSSLRWPIAAPQDRRFRHDPALRAKVERSLSIDEVDADGYDIVFLAGGWGAAYDLGQSAVLGQKMTQAYAHDAIIGGVCHGPLGLLNAKAADGSVLIEGRKISAVTDRQIKQLGIDFAPMHPERDLRAAGVRFEAEDRLLDVLASRVVTDGRIVTGQNQNSAAEAAHKMMSAVLAEQPLRSRVVPSQAPQKPSVG
jgi:putative intracellular protease/amidase